MIVEIVVPCKEQKRERTRHKKKSKIRSKENEKSKEKEKKKEKKKEKEDTKKKKSMLVFLVCHGEREDEASMYKGFTKMQRVDPKLTALGHGQAQIALTNLVRSLAGTSERKKRVAVFSSPLRCAIGTALMLSAANTPDYEDYLEWTLPIQNKSDRQTAIPIVILNGLCDCTPQVRRLGGNSNAIHKGFVRCAATSNTYGQVDSEMMKTIRKMKGLARADCSQPVQFFKPEGKEFVPMTPYISASFSQDNDFVARSDRLERSSSTEIHHFTAIEQAVFLAAESGCGVCIVISHREEIRDLAKQKCGYDKGLDIPNCCIAQYVVQINEQSKLRWTMYGVTSPEKVATSSIPKIPPELPFHPDVCDIKVSLNGQNSVTLCTVVFGREDLKTINAIGILGCTLTSTQIHKEGVGPSDVLKLPIQSGHTQWAHFLQTLMKHRHDAWGRAKVKLVDGTVVERALLVRLSHQPEFPCPSHFAIICLY